MLLLAVTAVGSLYLRRPGYAIGLMLLLGRQSFDVGFAFPLVSLPLVSVLAGAIFRERTIRLPPSFVTLPLLWFGLYTLARPYLSTESSHDLDASLAMYILLALFPMTIAAATVRLQKDVVRDFARSVVALGVGLSAIAIVTSGGARAGALGGGPITLAQTSALGAIFIATNFAGVRDRLQRIVYVPTFVFLCYAVVWSQSRGPTLALALALVTLLSVRRSNRVPGVKVIFSVLAVAQAFNVLGTYGLLPRRLSRLTRFQEEVTRSRGVVWEPAMEVITDSPIFGCGVDCYFLATGSRFTYPHNLFLEAQIVGGVIGAFFMVWSIYRLSAPLVRGAPTTFCVLLVPVLASMLSGDIYNNRAIWVVGVLLLGVSHKGTDLGIGGRQVRATGSLASNGT